MSMRLTLRNLRYAPDGTASRLSVMAGVCPTDSRLTQWVNNFQDRALAEGRWWGTTAVYRFCISSACSFVLPREVAVIEAANLNGSPMTMGSSWYQFVYPHVPCGSILGYCGCGCGCTTNFSLQDKNTAASFATTQGTNKKIRVYPTHASDVGKKIIIQGYDSNGIWVRTSYGGLVQDGEQVTLALPHTDTATIWGPQPNKGCNGAPVNVIKDRTNYRVLLYSLNTDDATEIQLARYEPNETEPMYRVVTIPNFRTTCGCDSSTLTAIVSLQHVPVVNDTDFLLFQNMASYQMGVLAEKHMEEGNIQMFNAYFYGTQVPSKGIRSGARLIGQSGAIPTLQAELRKMTGDVSVINIRQTETVLTGFV